MKLYAVLFRIFTENGKRIKAGILSLRAGNIHGKRIYFRAVKSIGRRPYVKKDGVYFCIGTVFDHRFGFLSECVFAFVGIVHDGKLKIAYPYGTYFTKGNTLFRRILTCIGGRSDGFVMGSYSDGKKDADDNYKSKRKNEKSFQNTISRILKKPCTAQQLYTVFDYC